MLTVYEPKYEDLWFRQMMMADEETMSYNHAWGGTIPFPEEDWQEWYDCQIINSRGRRYYRYLKDEVGSYIGEIAYHYDSDIGGYIANVIICSAFRGKGYGSRALDILCDIAKENGITVLYDDIAIDNPAITMFLKHGFTEEYRADEIIMLKKDL